MQHFEAAPWSTALKVVSTLATLLLAAVAIALFHFIPRGTAVPFAETFGTIVLIVPVATLLFAVLFIVSGYDLDRHHLYVQRLLWRTSIPLDGLTRAWHDPAAMRRSMRLFGNGGLFGITGIYQNKTLGRYRAFVTDPRQTVVLQLASRTVVISPAYPQAFLGELRLLHPQIAVV